MNCSGLSESSKFGESSKFVSYKTILMFLKAQGQNLKDSIREKEREMRDFLAWSDSEGTKRLLNNLRIIFSHVKVKGNNRCLNLIPLMFPQSFHKHQKTKK